MWIRIVLLIAILAGPVWAMQPQPLHVLMEAAAIASQSYGPKHPRVAALNEAIDQRLSQGERVDADALEKRLVDLVQERGDLRKRYGARHPKTIDNAKRLYAVSGLLISAE